MLNLSQQRIHLIRINDLINPVNLIGKISKSPTEERGEYQYTEKCSCLWPGGGPEQLKQMLFIFTIGIQKGEVRTQIILYL